MSPICQTFVQNAWRKDLCSNCFKSEEEHGNSRGKDMVEASKRGCYPDGSALGGRYVSVAGRPGLYPRNYYGSKSWNPLMLDNSHNDSRILKSPGLIKGMNCIIKQENDKNRNLSDLCASDKEEMVPKRVDDVSMTKIPKESWILTQIIGDTKLKSVERSERIQGDSSSDLGSDSSHDTSVGSGNMSGCSDMEVKADSDVSSLKSESDSAHGEEYPVVGILKSRSISFPLSKAGRVSISFKQDHEVIGYGGDVDYSDDDYEADEDDDNSSISSSELSLEDRTLKRLTEENTNFNSDNDNLADDSARHGNDSFDRLKDATPKNKHADDANKQEVRVKLKRSQPILGAKPQIKSNFTPFSSSQSSSLILQGPNNKECIPMQGIKPKFVSPENEMRENSHYEEMYETDSKLACISNFSSKITSIDDISPMVTSLDISSQDSSSDKVASELSSGDDNLPNVSSGDNSPIVELADISTKTTSIDASPETTSIDALPKTTPIDTAPKMLIGGAPQTTPIEAAFKTTLINASSKTTSIDASPQATSIDAASKTTSIDASPQATSIDAASKTTSTNTPSKTTSINTPPKTKSLDSSPRSASIYPLTSVDNNLPSLKINSLITSVSSVDDAPKSSHANSPNATPNTLNDPNSSLLNEVSTRSLSNCNKLPSSFESRSSIFTKRTQASNGSSETTLTSGVTSAIDLKTSGKGPEELPNPQMVPKNENVSNYPSHSTNSKEERLLSSSSFDQEKKDLYHSVRSAERENLIEATCVNASKIDSEVITSEKEVGTSKDAMDKISSAVVPLNMVTIQRRSSFMESQLGGSVYSIDNLGKVLSGRINNTVDTAQSKTSVSNKVRSPSSENTLVSEGTERKLNERDLVSTRVSAPQSQITNSCLPSTLKLENEQKQVTTTNSETIQTLTLQNSNSTSDVNSVVGNIYANKDLSKTTEFSMSKLKTKTSDNFQNATEISVNKSTISPSMSNSLSTFGTPVTGTNPPNSSFLHSGVVRPLTELKEINSVIYSTPEFLRGIKSPSTQPSLTASIQKSAIHTPSSSLKGVSLVKPATTPKPSYLKDKPKVPIKPFKNSTKVFAREIGSEKRVNVETVTSETLPENISENSDLNTPESLFGSSPPTSSIESQPLCSENRSSGDIIYDIPVTIGDSVYSGSTAVLSAPSPSSSSSGYSSSTNVSQSCEPMMTILDSELPDSLECPVASNPYVDDDEEIDEAVCKAKFELSQRALSEALFPNEIEESHEEGKMIEDRGYDVNEEFVRSATTEGIEVDATNSNGRMFGVNREGHRGSESSNSPQLRPPTEISVPISYTHLHPPYDTHDVDSYSSFTDDFDDEEEEEEDEDFKTNRIQFMNLDNGQKILPLRRTERSSSAAPLFRNSVGPIAFSPLSGLETTSDEGMGIYRIQGIEKLPATRSQSVPRSGDHLVNPAVFGKNNKPESSSSKFGFKSGFFRPSSPPSAKRKLSSDRGRDRTKKSLSVFSLKKFLRFGSGEKSLKGTKEPKSPPSHEGYQRETRKLKLHIIHPLDYNTNGVEVISRPEKRSPTYDFTGINDPLIQEALKQHAQDLKDKRVGNVTQNPHSGKPSGKKEESSSSNKSSSSKVSKKNSFLKKRRKSERKQADRSDSNVSTSHLEEVERPTGVKGPQEGIAPLSKNDGASRSTPSSTSAHPTMSVNLGFNSEGRPRPPPPPRKTSLDTNAQQDAALKPPSNFCPRVGAADFNGGSSSSKTEGDTSSLSSSCSSTRPHRPPPPRRTPSNSGSSQGLGCPRTKDSLYANLGNARAPFTPRKPGRTSSMKDEEREKRKAPNPPLPPHSHPPHQSQVSAGLKDELSESLQNLCNRLRPSKGPAPLAPGSSQEDLFHAHDYEYITNSSDERGQEKSDSVVTSSAPSPNAKIARQKGRRGSVVTNLSLEDQYGAVVFANLEALSNILDQMCSYSDCSGYETVIEDVTSCSQIQLRGNDPILCGLRLFYHGTVLAHDVTVMVTPETKVEVDSLLVPNPILTFKDEIPSSFFGGRRSSDHSFTSGSVWILPEMEISSLEEFTHDSQRLLQERPSEWERRICLFLLQVVSALKQLQAKGTEETSLDTILVITKIQGEHSPRLLMGSSDGNGGGPIGPSDNFVSLCHCAAAVTQLLLGHHRPLEGALKGPVLSSPLVPSPHAFSALVSCLRDERSGSLTKAKCILEGMLFGPEERNGSIQVEGEGALQKWLDLERANLLHSLVRDQASGHFNRNCLMTKFHLLFLVRTNVKALKEALRVLESPDVTDF